MGRLNYKRLGDYIQPVDIRNKELEVETLLGVSNAKEFIPSIANTIGTDMSNYKVITKGQFAYVTVTSRNGDKLSVALLQEDKAIVSQAYTVFEVMDKSELLPDYLMMWFRRPEFDRYARFKSHGSAREVFDWEEMCEVRLPIPDIEVQRKIVAQHETITRRIALNERICANLEETAQALYNKMFVQDIDPNNLPDGWRIGSLRDFATLSGGRTCTTNKSAARTEKYQYPIAGATGVIGYSTDYNADGKLLTIGRVGSLGIVCRYDEPVFMADNVLVISSKHYHFCEQVLKSINYEEIKKGGVQSLITQKELNMVEVILPVKNAIEDYERRVTLLYDSIYSIEQQSILLTTILSLITSRMH